MTAVESVPQLFSRGVRCPVGGAHNPETQSYDKEILFYEERCTGCGACDEECGNGAVRMERGKAVTKRESCVACGACIDGCVNQARELCGRTYEVRELAAKLMQDRAFFETSGGGVILSGGEVLAQDPEYVENLTRILAQRGISVNIDTCGAAPFEAFERVLPYTDTFLYDLKLLDEEKHRKYTGSFNRQILENLKKLSLKGAKLWIRIPVIGGVNDNEKEIGELGGFLKEQEIGVRQINLLPYHNTGSGKYGRLDRRYESEEFYVPSDERMQALRALLMGMSTIPIITGG